LPGRPAPAGQGPARLRRGGARRAGGRLAAAARLEQDPPLPAHTHTVATGGMPGWQITLIAAAAVLLAAALALTVYRIRDARRRVMASTAQAMTASGTTPG
jgi:hypothetical protein